ncbi:MAG: VOC family protein, partial [Desulfobacula sp.]|nr:VOC family protein [Desulfobacula sp.]
MNLCFIDHITIASPTLEVGAELVYRSLGVKPQKGGEHPRMGT